MIDEITPDEGDIDVEDIIDVELADTTSQNLLAELKARCATANVEFRSRTYDDGKDAIEYTSIALPSGREKRWVATTGTRLGLVLEIEFEKITFLQGYEAICSYDRGFIEVGIRGGSAPTPMLLRNLLGRSTEPDAEQEFVLSPPEGLDGRPIYKIGPPSPEFMALLQSPGLGRRPTLKLEGLTITKHDQAVELLQRYANSLLFQLDLLFGTSAMLERERLRRFRPIRRRGESAEIEYPTAEYDEAPLSLYWYARSARGMPLLQFLAFYQCIEFYFPTFSKAEARRKIALLLKDPTFRADRDSDVARLLSAISISRSGGFGDERTQLRASINECVNAEELRDFLSEDEERATFFGGKQKSGVHKIPIANEAADLRNDVADRLYNIRCRIVHTKDSDQHSGSMILPFSDEADYLIYDIELAQFVARKVLIATSSLFG